jgi:hypothetical protein
VAQAHLLVLTVPLLLLCLHTYGAVNGAVCAGAALCPLYACVRRWIKQATNSSPTEAGYQFIPYQ